MGNNLKVLLTGEGSDFGRNCTNVLRTYGCEVSLVAKDGKVLLSKLSTENPDVVIMDAFMANLDALGVVNSLKNDKKKAFCGCHIKF